MIIFYFMFLYIRFTRFEILVYIENYNEFFFILYHALTKIVIDFFIINKKIVFHIYIKELMCKNCDVIKGALYLKNKSLIGITKILQSYLHKCMLLMFANHLNNLQRK